VITAAATITIANRITKCFIDSPLKIWTTPLVSSNRDTIESVRSTRTAASGNTGGVGPDACIDAVGLEAHSPGLPGAYDRLKQAMMLESDRPNTLRQAIMCCRKGGTLPGVYGGFLDKMPAQGEALMTCPRPKKYSKTNRTNVSRS
jgi:threonine dehydrogenase-like Zn-dependent dehydrogenase